jgi:hypothetical protein
MISIILVCLVGLAALATLGMSLYSLRIATHIKKDWSAMRKNILDLQNRMQEARVTKPAWQLTPCQRIHDLCD